jgi:hypothetical protein
MLNELTALLRGRRYRTAVEKQFQDDVETVLKAAGRPYEREYPLSSGPIDFWLPDTGYGIECKIKGSPSSILQQLIRYAGEEPVSGLLLLTSRRQHSWPQATLGSKPFGIIWTGGTF